MSFARRISTRQLIALCAVVVAAAVAGTALAVAAGSGGPKPRPKSLAAAIHDAAAAPAPGGVTARIDFTNHLISASSLEGSDPLLSGASGRLWVTKDGHVRVELQSSRGDAQIVSDGSRFWAYDASANTVYHGQIPQHAEKKHEAAHHAPTLGQINGAIGRLSKHLALSGASPGDVAGQPAYTVRVAPKDSGGLLGAVSLAWDSVRGVPLRVALYARGHDTPVIEVKVTDISYGPVAAGDLAISPPKGAKSVDVSPPQLGRAGHRGGKKPVTGLAAVHKAVGFPVTAPASLAGRPRTGVRAVGGDKAGALLTYGRGLGTIAVLERSAKPDARSKADAGSKAPSGSKADVHSRLNLPTVSVRGATGHELDTALGTLIQFDRAGVSYTVLGSVSPTVARAAARGL